MTTPITLRQGQFLAFILRYTERRGISPSFDELAAHFGITSPSVNGMIKTLERKGLISRVPGAARTLRVEVPSELLPVIDFGRPTKRGKDASPRQETSPSDSSVAAAIAILDTVMPVLLEHGITQHKVFSTMQKAAQGFVQALKDRGLSPEESLAAGKQIAAQTARWLPYERGISVRGHVWTRQ